MDLITALWDGQRESLRRRTRKDQEIVVHNPWLNLIACTTPAWLKENFPEVQVGAGLTSRIIFVYGSEKRKFVAYPGLQIEPEDYADEELALLHDLKHIAGLQGEYKLTPSAIDWGESWYRHHFNGGKPKHLTSGRFDGYLARKQTHIHKLAMVIAASKRDALDITATDLAEAEVEVTALERDMVKVFDSIGVSHGARSASEVVVLIRNHKSITYQALWRQCFNTMDQKVFVESIQAAVSAGHIRKEAIPSEQNNYLLTYTGGKH